MKQTWSPINPSTAKLVHKRKKQVDWVNIRRKISIPTILQANWKTQPDATYEAVQ
jgi:hypothetical protein